MYVFLLTEKGNQKYCPKSSFIRADCIDSYPDVDCFHRAIYPEFLKWGMAWVRSSHSWILDSIPKHSYE